MNINEESVHMKCYAYVFLVGAIIVNLYSMEQASTPLVWRIIHIISANEECLYAEKDTSKKKLHQPLYKKECFSFHDIMNEAQKKALNEVRDQVRKTKDIELALAQALYTANLSAVEQVLQRYPNHDCFYNAPIVCLKQERNKTQTSIASSLQETIVFKNFGAVFQAGVIDRYIDKQSYFQTDTSSFETKLSSITVHDIKFNQIEETISNLLKVHKIRHGILSDELQSRIASALCLISIEPNKAKKSLSAHPCFDNT